MSQCTFDSGRARHFFLYGGVFAALRFQSSDSPLCEYGLFCQKPLARAFSAQLEQLNFAGLDCIVFYVWNVECGIVSELGTGELRTDATSGSSIDIVESVGRGNYNSSHHTTPFTLLETGDI